MAMSSQREAGLPQYDVYFAYSQMANLYNSLNQNDSALWYATRGYELGLHSRKDVQRFFALACGAIGSVYQKLQKYELAENYFRQGIAQSQQYNNIYFLARNYNNLANLFDKMNLRDSAHALWKDFASFMPGSQLWRLYTRMPAGYSPGYMNQKIIRTAP